MSIYEFLLCQGVVAAAAAGRSHRHRVAQGRARAAVERQVCIGAY